MIANGKADEQGNFSIDLNPPKNNGEKVEVTATDKAGNTSKPTDVTAPDITPPNKPENLDVSDDGTRVTGTAEPGSTVVIRDENGDQIGSATADPETGAFEAELNTPKTNGETLTAEATDGAGNTSPKAGVDADDNTAPPAPTLTNDSEDNKLVATEDKDITGSAPDAAGGTAVLVDGDGNPVKDSAGNPITAPIDNNGNFTLPAAGVPDGDYGVQVKDKAGNSSTDNAPISIDRTVPKITSVEFADNNNPSDNQLTRNEVGTDGKTWVNVNFDKATVKVDDVIKVNGVDHKITEADITAGQAQIEIPVGVAPGSQGTLKVTAQITDTAGNQSSTADNSIAVNRAVDGIPRVEYIDNGANGGSKDGTLTAAEITGDGTDKTTARIVLPDNLGDGDTVSIPDLSETPYMVSGDKVGDFPIGTNAKGEKYIDVQVPVAEGATSLTTLVVVTVDGTDLPATGNIKVDTVAPQEAPVLTVEGVTAEDTTINAAEAKDGLDLKVTIPQGTQEGDHIIIKDGATTLLDRPLTKEEAESNEISLNIAAPANGITVNLTATVKEPREDGIAKTSAPAVTATVDTAIPGGVDANGDGLGDAAPVITFTQDTQPEDDQLNAAELNGQKAAVTIEVPTDVVINDTLVYTVNGGTEQTVNITAAVKDNGFTVPADQLPETGTITVKAYVKDAAGNRSAEAEEAAKIDTSIGKPTPTAGEDGSVNITLPSDAEKGDTVKVEYTDEAGKPQTVTLTKGDDGWTSDKPELIKHPTGDTATIPEEGVKDNTSVTITAKDTAGNTSSADPFNAPDVTAPSKPELTPNDNGSVKLDLPTDANVGDKVEVKVIPEGGTAENPTTVTLEKQPDGTWESNKPTIIPSTAEANKDTTTIPENQVKDGSQVTAVATNSSDPTTADATDTRTPMLSLTEQSADKVLGKDEGNSITGKVTYDSTEETADKAEGATVILKNAQGEQVAKTTAAADGTFTFASVADGTYSIEVTSASNVAGTPITDVLVDHKAPVAQDITLANDTAGASATDNISYDGTLVIPTLGDGESIKSVTVGGATVTPDPVTGKYVLNPGEYAVGTIKVVVEDKAGYETESSNSKTITIDTTAPGQPTIDPQTNGSVNITLPSGENVKADDTVEVTYTDESGVKQTVTFTKGEDGWTSDKPTLIANPTGNTATIPAASVQDGSEVNAVAKDPAGNASTAASQNAGNNPDTTAPSAPKLNPNADGTMDVVLPEDAKPGDKVVVTVTPDGATEPNVVTLTKKDDGTWESGNEDVIPSTTANDKNTATIPEDQVKDGSPVTAVATDDAGNSSAPTTKNATDTRTPVVSLTGDSDDKVLKATEGDDITGTVKYSDGDIAEGAKVELFNAQGTKVKETTAAADGTFTFADVADGTYSIKVTSASGIPGTGVDKVVVDHDVPGDASSPLDGTSDQAPSVQFVENDQNPADGKISRNEIDADGTVKVKVTLPEDNVNAGDTVVLITNGSATPVEHQLTADEAEVGEAIISIPVGNVGNNPGQPVDGEKLTVKAVVKDQADQESLPSTEVGIFVNQRVTGAPSVAYPEDGANGGFKDKVLWATEIGIDNSTPVKVVLPSGIKGGDTVTVTINDAPVINHVVVQQDAGTGKRTITVDEKVYEIKTADESLPEGGKETITFIEVPVSTEGKTEIKAVVDVAIANDSTSYHAEGTVTIDTAVPGGDSDNNNQGDETDKPALTIAEAANGVNADELSDGKVEAKVTLPAGVQAGDHIILKDANGNVLADVQVDTDKAKDDVVTIEIPKAKLPDDDYKVTAIVKEDGTNGRESAPSNEVSFKVDTDAPNAPELTVNNGGVNIALPADAQKGDTVEVKYTDENGEEQTVTLTKGDNGWTSGNKDVIPDSSTNQVTLPANQVKDGTEVNATASDGINDVPADPVTVNDTRTPVITLTGESADNQLVKTDGNTITGTVTYSDGDTAEAAKVTLVNTETNAEKEVTVRADGTFSFTDVADGVYTVKAKTVGNVEASNTPTVTVDHTGPADAAITFVNNTGTADDKISSDGTLNIAPANGAGIVDGSVEYSKDGGDWTDVPVVNGKYVLPEDGTYSVRVTTEDNVGNTTTTTVDNFVVDTAPPADATIKLTSDSGESGDNISKDGGLTITPADDATIQKVEYQDATGWHTFEGETYTLPAGTYAAGAIKVTTVDTAGNTKETFNTDVITVDQTPPTQGTVTIAKDSGTSVEDGITNDGTLVTPTLGEGESIKSVIADGETIDAVDGKYVLPEKTYGAGTIKVTVVDKAGNETVSTNAAPITVDKTLPIEPTVTPATADGDGSVTVGLPTDAKVGDKVEVSVTPEGVTDPVTITLTKGENNSWTPSADLPTGVTLNGDTLTIGEDAVEDGTPVNAKSIDVAGNENAATAGNAGNDALSTTPTVTVTDSKNGYVNKTAIETDGGLNGTTTNAPDGSTIKLLDKNGNPVDIGTVTVTGDTFTIPADKVPDGDYTITVTTPAEDGGKSASTGIFTVDTKVTAPSLSTTGNDGDGSVTVGLPTEAKVGDKVEVSVIPEGGTAENPTKVILEKQPDGTWKSDKPTVVPSTTMDNKDTTTIPENAVEDGSKVTAKSVDTAGNEAEADSATAGSDEPTPSIAMGAEVAKGVNATELSNGIPGTVENAPAGAKVQLYKGNTPIGDQIDVIDGAFTIPSDIADGDYTVKLVGYDDITADFTVDTTVHAPTVTASTENGNGGVTVALPTTDVKVGDKVEVTFTGEDDQPVTITLTKGQDNWAPSEALPTGVDLFGDTLTIGEDAVKDGSEVKAKSVDTAGNEAEADSATAGSDEPTPSITMDAEVDNGVNKDELSNGIPGTVENAPVGAQVQLYNAEGEKVGSPVDVNPTTGAFTIPKDGVTDGDGYTVKLVNNETVASDAFAVDTTAPEASVTANTNGSVEIALPANPENGDTVTITYTPTGANQATTATLTYDGSNWTGIPDGFTLADGTVTIPADKVADNTIVKAVGSDLAGNTQSPAASGTTATDPVSGVTVKDLTENGVVLDGSTGTNNTINFVKAADLGGVVSVQGPAGTTSTVTFTSANGKTVEKTVSNDGTEKAINLTPEQVKTLTGGGSQAISVKVATGDLGEQNYSDVFTINPTSDVFELIPSVNNVSTNDSVHPEVDAVLNGTEQALGAGGKDTAISYMLIIPSTAQIGDKVTVYNGTTEVPFTLDTQAKVDSWKAGKTGLRYNIDLDESTLSTGQEITLKAIYTPKDGQPQTLSHTYWYDGKAPTVGVETTDTTATVTLPTESDAASVTVKVGDATVTLVKDSSNWVSQAGNTITPAIENGKAVFSDLATGTAVTATATDTVGNTSAEVSAVTQIIPMSISAVSVTDEDTSASGTQVVDNDVSFSYTLAGQLDEGKLIRVRVVDESGAAVGETKYFTPTQGETTGSLALPAADGQALKVVADIVDAVYRDSAVDGSAKNAAFTLDNVTSHNASLTGNSNVTIDGTPVNHTFGTAQKDKYYDVGNVRVYNPKLDWEMRWEDNTMPGKGWRTPPGNGDNKDGKEYHLDTAPNWSDSEDGYKYYWTGVADKSHVIIAAKVRTDDGYGEAYKQGLIGTENAYDGKTHFEMNTNSNLADYIQSEGIVGNVNISTQGGDDTITTKYLNGKYWVGKGDFNGSERIFMGDGNDTFEVTGSAYSTGYGDSLADNAAFYMTNAKIDMGGGNDIVKITGGQITAGREFNVGNYFLLGSGNDVMETRTITSEKDEDQATNIINLGSGHDILTVNGDIMSHEDAVYRTANPRNGTDQQARFLLMSRDSSDVHITGNVGGKVTMLMGSGDDNIRIDQELWMSDKDNAMDWLSITLNRAEISGNKDYYINEDSKSIRGEINTALATGVSNSGATGLGATSLTNNQNEFEQDDLHITNIAARIDLGDGNNIFTVGGGVTNANILSGEGKDVVKLGFHSGLSGDASFNWRAATDNTKVWTGAGNDLVMMVNVANNVKVYTSADSDDIQLYNVNGKNNEIHAGNGGDIIRLYGVVNNSNSNTIDGGADYDKVIIGNKNDSAASKFLVGGSEDGYTNLWSIEEIQFNSGVSGSGDTVKVNAQILNDNHTLYIRGTSELNAQGTEALGVNTVDIDTAVWKDKGTTTKELSDGTSYTYHHYSYDHDNTTEHLYIQNGIRVL